MYSVKIEHFEGPMDLLLQLIEGEKLDIKQISLAKITNEFLNHLPSIDSKNYDITEFLLIASKLLYIKSKVLLPKIKNDEEEEEIDDLEAKLKEYKKYKEAAKKLQEVLDQEKRAFQKKYKHTEKISVFTPPQDIDLNKLLFIFNGLLKNTEKEIEKQEKIIEKSVTVEEKIYDIRNILKKKKKMQFSRTNK